MDHSSQCSIEFVSGGGQVQRAADEFARWSIVVMIIAIYTF